MTSEDYEERAAIREHLGGLPRALAEAAARDDVLRMRSPMLRAPTGSQIELFLACLGPSALPRVVDEGGEAAQRGVAIHEYMRAAVVEGREIALAQTALEYREECAALELPELAADAEVHAEAAYAWDWSTDRTVYLGDNIGRGYPPGTAAIAATADLVVVERSGRIRVIDYKTGRSDVTAASDNGQLALLALAVARYYRAPEVQVELWRLREDGTWYRDVATLDALDLDAWAARLSARMRALLEHGAAPDLRTGPHCGRCPSRLHCPARTSLLRATVEQGAAGPVELTRETAGAAWVLLERLEEAAEQLRRELEAMAAEGPLALPDGRQAALQVQSREFIVGEVAEQMLQELVGGEVAQRIVKRSVSVTQADLKRQLGKQAGEVLAELRRRGAMSAKQYTRVVAK